MLLASICSVRLQLGKCWSRPAQAQNVGKNALPAVLAAMKAPSTSREAMEVAVSVWMTIQKGQSPTGVALLKREADTTKDHEARQRLGWAAFRAAQGWCSPSEKAPCKAVLTSKY